MNGHGLEVQPERVLLVEGQDDKHVVRNLCNRHDQIPEFSIREKGGIEKLLEAISPEIKVSARKAVGIVIDADDDLTARWSAVVHRLGVAGIQPPSDPKPAGTIIPGTPSIGIWIMPDNQSSGELEDFAIQMIPSGDLVWPKSEKYIDCIPHQHRKFADRKTTRAKLYAWLATREEPGRMGSAINRQDLSINGYQSRKFVAWLRRLFG